MPRCVVHWILFIVLAKEITKGARPTLRQRSAKTLNNCSWLMHVARVVCTFKTKSFFLSLFNTSILTGM